MWTAANRAHYERKGSRYPSDLTDEEWSYVEPLIPPAKRGGRPREVDVREVLTADIQDRDGGVLVLETLAGRFAFLRKPFADGGY